MKKTELKTIIPDFTYRCLTNEYHGGKIFEKLIKKAQNLEEFKQLVKNNPEINKTQGTMELFKDNQEYPIKFLKEITQKEYHTGSDAGSLKIFNKNLSILIPNGYGDGKTITYIIPQNAKIHLDTHYNSFTVIKGEFNIAPHDCSNEIMDTIKGEFYIYYGNSTIILKGTIES